MSNQTSDFIIFTDLIHEYNESKQKEVEKKIKRRLKYHKLGPYDQERVDYIRQLKNTIWTEIRLQKNSRYFKKTPSVYAEIEDFDIKQMLADYKKDYDKLSARDLRAMIGWAVHWYHTR